MAKDKHLSRAKVTPEAQRGLMRVSTRTLVAQLVEHTKAHLNHHDAPDGVAILIVVHPDDESKQPIVRDVYATMTVGDCCLPTVHAADMTLRLVERVKRFTHRHLVALLGEHPWSKAKDDDLPPLSDTEIAHSDALDHEIAPLVGAPAHKGHRS